MVQTRLLTILALAAYLSGCDTAPKNYDYMKEPAYAHRPKLSQSLVSSSGPEALSEAAIQKILSSRVSLPKKINLAVVRLGDADGAMGFQTIDENLAAQFYNKEVWGPRVQSVIPVPDVMIPRPVSLMGLRQAAVLLQADALVIIQPASYGDWKFEWFEPSKGKGVSTLQVLLLDTRTSVVPYTELVSETAEIRKTKEEYGEYELVARAKKASEEKAMLKVAPDIQKFLSRTL